ncbi:hypothetical protein GCM10010244_37620 [Streptomyces coeruleorubidus]|nr:hypothetical protein GCM10010244_37620 [Streptomyces bellus]
MSALLSDCPEQCGEAALHARGPHLLPAGTFGRLKPAEPFAALAESRSVGSADVREREKARAREKVR